MSKSFKALLAVGCVAFLAACGNNAPVEEYVVVDEPAPISEEPVYTGKYK